MEVTWPLKNHFSEHSLMVPGNSQGIMSSREVKYKIIYAK